MKPDARPPASTAFLLAQVGAHAAGKFAERLAVLEVGPPHAGTLRVIHLNPGISQRALSSILGMVPSRLVVLVDELEGRGLVERRDTPQDRRVYSLYLTRKGTEVFEAIGKLARAHEDAVCAALSSSERETLAALLRRIADEQGLVPGVHPGFARWGRAPSTGAASRAGTAKETAAQVTTSRAAKVSAARRRPRSG